ncbi:MAG: RNA polymerase sigma factor [Rhodanobacteraceae bacterium]
MASIETASNHNAPWAGALGTCVAEGEDGFSRFARNHHCRLVQFLRTYTPTLQDAEDAAQESIIKLMRYRYSVPASDWSRLLYRIAINTAHDRFRAASRHRAITEAAHLTADLVDAGCCPDEYAAREQVLERTRQVILGLPPKCRKVCVLKLTRDMTNAQIAGVCGISTKMVEKHLAKGLATLRRKVGNWAPAAFKQS